MFRSKRVLWAAGVFIAGLFLTPLTALSVEEDPYINKSLIGRVYLEYQKSDIQSERGLKIETSRFQQVYSLDVRGNYLSRNMLIYDAGISYAIDDYTSSSSSSSTTMSYYGRTTLLPKSNIPLTLNGRKTESVSRGRTSTTTGYGLNWTVKIRPLPIMQLSLDTTKHESPETEYKSTKYKFDARKDMEIGPSNNSIYFTKSATSNSNAEDSSLYSLNFMNNTKISKSNSLDFSASRNGSEQGDSDTTAEGYSVTLRSTPGIDFSQSQTYTYYSTKSPDSKQEGSAYAGSMAYRFNRDLSTSFNFIFNSSDSESATIDRETKNLISSGNISYRLLSSLMLTENVSYTNYETINSFSQTSSLENFESFSSNTGLSYSYSRPLGWAFLTANYGLGYVIEKSTAGKGTGISQDIGLGLADIDFNRYAIFNTATNYSSVENTSGDVKSDTKRYSASAKNKIGAKYLTTTASYDKSLVSSWVPGADTKTESYRADARTAYFKNTTLAVFANNIKTFNEATGWSSTMSEGLTLNQQLLIFSSPLAAYVELIQTERDYVGGKDKSLTKHANARYAKVIKRPIFWDIEGDWLERKDNTVVSRTSYIQNRLVYPLRAWLFSFEHRYTLSETTVDDIKENLYLFKAMRTFVRFF